MSSGPFRRICGAIGLVAAAILAVGAAALAQSDTFTFAVTLYNPLTNASAIGYVQTDGFDAELISRFTYTEADGLEYHGSPSFSPDGSTLLFVAQPSDRLPQIYVQSVVDGLTEAITTDAEKNYMQAVWSPDGTKIAYAAADRGRLEDIFVMNADGSGSVQITDTPELSEIGISWSPDGTTLLYVQRESQLGYQLMTIPAEGGQSQPVGDPALVGTTPKWSVDGTRLFFATRDMETLTATIQSAAPDGSDAQTLYTITGSGDSAPGIDGIAVSPDGSTLAFVLAEFVSSVNGNLDLVNTLHLLSLETLEVESPVWITDGLWVGSLDFEPTTVQ